MLQIAIFRIYALFAAIVEKFNEVYEFAEFNSLNCVFISVYLSDLFV